MPMTSTAAPFTIKGKERIAKAESYYTRGPSRFVTDRTDAITSHDIAVKIAAMIPRTFFVVDEMRDENQHYGAEEEDYLCGSPGAKFLPMYRPNSDPPFGAWTSLKMGTYVMTDSILASQLLHGHTAFRGLRFLVQATCLGEVTKRDSCATERQA